MWREFIKGFTERANFAPPATPQELADLENNLGIVLPPNLRSLLQECNGLTVSDDSYFDSIGEMLYWCVICSTDEIIKLNEEWRRLEEEWRNVEEVTAPITLKNLLLFTNEPNGDPVGFPIKNGIVDEANIVIISHEGAEPQTKSMTLREQIAHLIRVV